MRRSFAVAALLATVVTTLAAPATAPLRAQSRGAAPASASALTPGARVRLTAPGARGVFEVVMVSADTLVVRRDATAAHQRVPFAAASRIDVSRGPRSVGNSIGRGATLGFVLGGVGGVVLGAASGSEDTNDFAPAPGTSAVMGGLAGGLLCGIVGGIIGSAIRGELWQRVDMSSRLALVAPPTGRGLGVRLGSAF